MIVEFLRKLAVPGIETRIEVDKITLREKLLAQLTGDGEGRVEEIKIGR